MAILSKKSSHLIDISLVLSKTFCALILIMHSLLWRKNQKNVLQKEIEDWNFKAYLLTKETSSWFSLIKSLKITCTRFYPWFLNFYQTEGLDCFSQPNLPKLSEVTVTCPNPVKKEQIGSILIFPKLTK